MERIKQSPPTTTTTLKEELKKQTPQAKPHEGVNHIDPEVIQSIDAIHSMILIRGEAATKQCYWCLVIDALVIGVMKFCQEMCKGCITDNQKKHDVCEQPMKIIWQKNRKDILKRVDTNTLTSKWTTASYTNCGLRPTEVETLFHLSDPRIMITRWYEDFHAHANTKVDYDDYDLERIPWRKEVNTRMTKFTHPANHCTVDRGLASYLQKKF